MDNLRNTSIKIKNYKCFSEQEQGFDKILPINIIIGRNNSGKSTLLELIEYSLSGQTDIPPHLWNKQHQPEIVYKTPLTENEVKSVFRENMSGGTIPGQNHWHYGRTLVGKMLEWRIKKGINENDRFLSIEQNTEAVTPINGIVGNDEYKNALVRVKDRPLSNKIFKRIHAERDIRPEGNQSQINVNGKGTGITNIIEGFINDTKYQSDLVEKVLLHELNRIFNPDSSFSDIVCQRDENGHWEIYLEEETKGRIALSHTGSGIKTVIMVLVFLLLLPEFEKKQLSEYVFAFEELENNLHPSLQRRLFAYINDFAKVKGCIFFITTHSNVVIDLFNKNPDAQIIHLRHNGESATAKTVKTYIDNKGVLDDLDVRASDLLQSNGIIWVEGPSDRIYMNRWIDIWSDGELQEGTHYQCVFYGGRLLSHLSCNDPSDEDDGISILRVNHNAIILIDSDKKTKTSKINDTKKRIKKEIEEIEGISWITAGKEIENYIPADAVSKLLKIDKVDQVGRYVNFFEYLNSIEKNKGTYYSTKKAMLAEEIVPHLSKENLNEILDLSKKLDSICDRIRTWNNIN